MNPVPLFGVKCPHRRKKAGKGDAICNALIVPGKDYGYCHKCSSFYRIARIPGRPLRLMDISKNKIEFMWLLVEYES